jgi:quinol monooxygenase YgiN
MGRTVRGMDSVYELRQYTLHPGQRDTLIDIFEREFVETQEAVGMRLPGMFRDLSDPDRFVWLRSFTDMPARAAGLQAFYTGPVWKAHARAANETMIDSDNVLLLRPTGPGAGFALDGVARPPVGAALASAPTVVAVICYLSSPVDSEQLDHFDQKVFPDKPIARLCTLYEENNFPGLPVRTGEHVIVWFSFAEPGDLLAQCSFQPPDGGPPPPLPSWVIDTEVLRLAPTARSLLR